tara:strand:+ start:551 stop:748 length:198 start_codon:yes stop_codon:yes gene_type:complete
MKYIGVLRARSGGRDYYRIDFAHKKIRYSFGNFKDPKEAAKAYDLFVIKQQLNRKTNFFKKRLAY